MRRRSHRRSRQLLIGLAIALGSSAHADSLNDAITGSKVILDTRLRYESVEQPTTAVRTHETAEAATIRIRVGFETAKAWNTSLLAEGEFVRELVDHYNSTANRKTQYPIIGDPRVSEINRLQLTNTSLNGTTITLGRQRLLLDDQRFVGNVGWRQNEQTFDALRVVNTSVRNLTLDATYANSVRRVFGENSVAQLPTFEGDVVLANASYQLPIGKATVFGYLLDFDNSAANSSATYGVRFAGKKEIGQGALGYIASYATQSDYADNPADYDEDYYLAELTATFASVSANVGLEHLSGNGMNAFSTPLATLHKFQGWADVFLTTPANGLEDRYVGVGYTSRFASFDAFAVQTTYHDFRSTRGSTDLGSEIDLQLSAKIRRFTALLKYADYQGPTSAQDVKKWWAEVAFAW